MIESQRWCWSAEVHLCPKNFWFFFVFPSIRFRFALFAFKLRIRPVSIRTQLLHVPESRTQCASTKFTGAQRHAYFQPAPPNSSFGVAAHCAAVLRAQGARPSAHLKTIIPSLSPCSSPPFHPQYHSHSRSFQHFYAAHFLCSSPNLYQLPHAGLPLYSLPSLFFSHTPCPFSLATPSFSIFWK